EGQGIIDFLDKLQKEGLIKYEFQDFKPTSENYKTSEFKTVIIQRLAPSTGQSATILRPILHVDRVDSLVRNGILPKSLVEEIISQKRKVLEFGTEDRR